MIIQPSKKSPLASASKPGLMSPSDKNKLDEIDIMTGATPDVEGTSGLVPVPAAGDQDKFLKADGTWGTPTDTKYSEATTTKSGLMSAADKAKLDEIDTVKGATTESLTLSASNWNSNTQEVSSSIATEDNVIIVSPTPDDQDTYSKCGIKCSAQAEGSLTFTCKTLPTIDIHVNVVTF